MNRTVDGNVFGGVITDIKADARYRVEFDDGVSETYRITTFEYPALVRADATITAAGVDGAAAGDREEHDEPRGHGGLARGFPDDGEQAAGRRGIVRRGQDDHRIEAGRRAIARVLEGGFVPVKSQKYRLHLVDDRERANKNPPWFTVRVLPNLPPKLEMTFPKRDLAVSPIQELPVEGKVWDDLGVLRAGATFMIGDETAGCRDGQRRDEGREEARPEDAAQSGTDARAAAAARVLLFVGGGQGRRREAASVDERHVLCRGAALRGHLPRGRGAARGRQGGKERRHGRADGDAEAGGQCHLARAARQRRRARV